MFPIKQKKGGKMELRNCLESNWLWQAEHNHPINLHLYHQSSGICAVLGKHGQTTFYQRETWGKEKIILKLCTELKSECIQNTNREYKGNVKWRENDAWFERLDINWVGGNKKKSEINNATIVFNVHTRCPLGSRTWWDPHSRVCPGPWRWYSPQVQGVPWSRIP